MNFVIRRSFNKNVLLSLFVLVLAGCQTVSQVDDADVIVGHNSHPESSLLSVSLNTEKENCVENNEIVIPHTIQQMADQGDANSQWLLALEYFSQSSCRASSDGLYWLELAANSGSGPAMAEMGYLLLFGAMGFEVSHDLAENWLRKGAQKNSVNAHYNMARLFRASELGGTPDDVLVSSWLKSALDLGHESVGFEYGFRCLEGLTGESISQCFSYIESTVNVGYSLTDYLNNTLARLELILAPIEWPLKPRLFRSQSVDPSDYPQLVGNMAHYLLTTKKPIPAHELVQTSVANEERSLTKSERVNYGVNLMYIAANLGDPRAQSAMIKISNSAGNTSAKAYWQGRLGNNQAPSIQ